MIVVWANDGQMYEPQRIQELRFRVDPSRDLRTVKTGEVGKGPEGRQVYDFVGFLTNDDDDVMAVFPKHFAVKDVEADAELVFQVINRHRQRFPEYYLGERYGESFRSNYPFAAFFGIYEYYQKYGLYVEEQCFTRAGGNGKVDWKTTVRRAHIYLAEGRAVPYPLYYRKKYAFSTFLTECMIFAIDYTIGKFGCFLGLSPTGHAFPEFDYLGEREYVAERLEQLRGQVFRDDLLALIDHLILFYSQIREGGCYYWKCDTFSSVWEDMVSEYLKEYFCGTEQERPVFDRERALHLPFEKRRFYANQADLEQYVELDAYAAAEDTQYIFDAKYYTHAHGLDYKQMVYQFLLYERYPRTFSALVLPGERRESRLHFEMAPDFNQTCGPMRIWEEYLDIREVMAHYSARG